MRAVVPRWEPPIRRLGVLTGRVRAPGLLGQQQSLPQTPGDTTRADVLGGSSCAQARGGSCSTPLEEAARGREYKSRHCPISSSSSCGVWHHPGAAAAGSTSIYMYPGSINGDRGFEVATAHAPGCAVGATGVWGSNGTCGPGGHGSQEQHLCCTSGLARRCLGRLAISKQHTPMEPPVCTLLFLDNGEKYPALT